MNKIWKSIWVCLLLIVGNGSSVLVWSEVVECASVTLQLPNGEASPMAPALLTLDTMFAVHQDNQFGGTDVGSSGHHPARWR